MSYVKEVPTWHVLPSICCCLRFAGTGASFLPGFVLCDSVCVYVVFYIAFGYV